MNLSSLALSASAFLVAAAIAFIVVAPDETARALGVSFASQHRPW